jgi:hypothetical protein
MNLIGADAWRWRVRPIGDGKFLMRFPTTKMANQWSNLKNLTMKNEAQIKIEASTPVVGVKGVLQSAWFRVSKIPADQRSIRTLAKVGGLVGKVIEVDEGTRFRYDYLRLRIACRDVSKVPKTAEAFLGMHLMKLGYEREVLEDGNDKLLKSGTMIRNEEHPSAKKSKPNVEPIKPSYGNGGKDISFPQKNMNDKVVGKQKMIWSAPPNMKPRTQSQSTFMKDAQKAYKGSWADDVENVHIPDTAKDLDSKSDSFSEKSAGSLGRILTIMIRVEPPGRCGTWMRIHSQSLRLKLVQRKCYLLTWTHLMLFPKLLMMWLYLLSYLCLLRFSYMMIPS